MSEPTVPFEVRDWWVDGFSVNLRIDLTDNPVDVALTWSEFGGWDATVTDSTGQEVDRHALAASLGFDHPADLWEALTDGLFTVNYRSAGLFVKEVTQ